MSSRAQLVDFDFSSLPDTDFVLKPNHGSKGKGIAILKSLGKGPKPEKNASSWLSFIKGCAPSSVAEHPEEVSLFATQGKIVSEYELKRQIIDILDGKHSLTMVDEAIIEEKLISGDGFKEFCEFGLADLRVIVFNLVPVAAMIRIPTEKSGGKANLNA